MDISNITNESSRFLPSGDALDMVKAKVLLYPNIALILACIIVGWLLVGWIVKSRWSKWIIIGVTSFALFNAVKLTGWF